MASRRVPENAQKNALIKTLKLNKIPFRETKIKNNNEQTLGELFTYFMLETIIVGELTGIDPFTQPAVEKVISVIRGPWPASDVVQMSKHCPADSPAHLCVQRAKSFDVGSWNIPQTSSREILHPKSHLT